MTHTDRTREPRARSALVWAVVTTGAASVLGSTFLAWEGLDQAATAVATTGVSVTTIGGAWAYVRSREVESLGRPHGARDGDGPVGPNGGGLA